MTSGDVYAWKLGGICNREIVCCRAVRACVVCDVYASELGTHFVSCRACGRVYAAGSACDNAATPCWTCSVLLGRKLLRCHYHFNSILLYHFLRFPKLVWTPKPACAFTPSSLECLLVLTVLSLSSREVTHTPETSYPSLAGWLGLCCALHIYK